MTFFFQVSPYAMHHDNDAYQQNYIHLIDEHKHSVVTSLLDGSNSY